MTLNDIMEFDHVIRVHEDGTITDEKDIYAPSLLDDQLDSEGWELLDGYSGQDRYSGPIMHNSEFIGGRMEDDIRERPGVYVAIVSSYSPEGPDDDLDVEGWAVARKTSPTDQPLTIYDPFFMARARADDDSQFLPRPQETT